MPRFELSASADLTAAAKEVSKTVPASALEGRRMPYKIAYAVVKENCTVLSQALGASTCGANVRTLMTLNATNGYNAVRR